MADTYVEDYGGKTGRKDSSYSKYQGANLTHSQVLITGYQIEGATYRAGTRRRKPVPINGIIPPTSYVVYKSNEDHGDSLFTRFNPAWNETDRWHGAPNEWRGMINDASYLPAVPSGMVSRTEVKALLELKNQKVNLAQAFAERKMTASLVASSLSRMTRSLNSLHTVLRGGGREALAESWRILRGLKRSPRALPQSWLEYQYGWTPLLNDIYGSASALRERKQVSDWLVTVKKSTREKKKVTDVRETITGFKANRTIETDVGVFVRFDVVPDNHFLQVVSSLGLSNPLLIAWELMPYSFVIDWFVPIGNWLSAMDATQGFKFGYGSKSIRREGVVQASYMSRTEGGYVYNSSAKSRKREFKLERTPYAAFPFPSFPGFKDPFSAAHVANGLSLFATALGGPGRRFDDRFFHFR